MDDSVILTEIQNLRREMNAGFTQIQATITKLEGEGRDTAVKLGAHEERMKNLDEKIATESTRNKESAQANTATHVDLYAKISAVSKASEAEDKEQRENVWKVRIQVALLALAAGGGGGLLSKLIH